MDINSNIDSNAIALDYRNFGALPPHLAKEWMVGFASVKNSKLKHPKKAIIEIINSCNLDCPMCRVGQYGYNLERVMPLKDFKKVISQINGLQTVRLNGLGESSLVPNLGEYLDLLFEKKLHVELISNGSGRVEVYKKILQNGGSIFISWDAAEKEIFEKLRRPANWEVFVKRIKNLTADSSDSESKRISLLFTLQEDNADQLSKLVLKCSEWKVGNIIVNAVKHNEVEWVQSKFEEILNDFVLADKLAKEYKINLFLPAQIFGRKIPITGAFPTNGEKCLMPWNEVVIRWNGDVQVCNMFNPYVYGNIHLNSFEEVWNGMFANLFRKMINTEKKHTYCIDCVYFGEGYQ